MNPNLKYKKKNLGGGEGGGEGGCARVSDFFLLRIQIEYKNFFFWGVGGGGGLWRGGGGWSK